MNSIKIMGRLSRDPDIRYTTSGRAVASFAVAVGRGKAPGQEKEMTDFIPVVVWGKLAETCGNSLSKGHQVFVEGRLQVRSYDTKDGQKKWVTEVVASFVGQSLESTSKQSGGGSPFDAMGQAVDEPIPF